MQLGLLVQSLPSLREGRKRRQSSPPTEVTYKYFIYSKRDYTYHSDLLPLAPPPSGSAAYVAGFDL